MMALPAVANQRCFVHAQSYYEQIYCQLEAEGKSQKLPSLTDFKRNNEQVQALLLKRPAEEIGITLLMPATKKPKQASMRFITEPVVSKTLSGCGRQGNRIQCAGGEYKLVGNSGNDKLSAEALTVNNSMVLPEYRGRLSNAEQVMDYLRVSYKHYLLKMIDIGLGGATLSYGKFAFLFDDLSRRGVSMTARFESMYRYLKKDKRSMIVPSKAKAPAELKVEDCFLLEPLIVCHANRQNWLFRRG
jgi:hypothetical protein